ncbi:hypothetical protein FQR65_LT04368 [Abscondita terminalis]|nr:hypothetical protein FQR65_LT04368 [Abscondita terminalis]
MRLTKSTVILLTSIIFLSMLLANVSNLLSTEPKHFDNEYLHSPMPMADDNKHLLWFLQISDIHISIFRDPLRITQFKEFCEDSINVFKPPVVLATGDLTDAKTSDNIGSQQMHKEWVEYRTILTDLKIIEKTNWLDIRGNHDNFNVLNFQSKENYYANYSIQGRKHARSYYYQLTKDKEVYSFIGVDACLQPGPRRPFNFVGSLDSEEISMIKNIVKQVELSNSRYTIWFGHYPTSCILSHDIDDIRSIIGRHKQGLAYLCGHLHTLGGLVPNMYTLQQDGFLELELGDWKNNRLYRLMAIDHGLLSFVDVKHGQWPVVLITNPKDALFLLPYKENLDTIKKSTHIRILAFSLARIKSVQVRINNEDWMTCKLVSGPLYVAPWNPQKYVIGVHMIEVNVIDVDGRTEHLTQPFSLDGTKLAFSFPARLVLMTSASVAFKMLFWIFNIISIVPLLLFKVLHCFAKDGRIDKPNARGGVFKNLVRKLWILSSIDRIFWPLVIYPIYLIVGPWSIGYIVEDHIGAIFAWGIYVNGTLLPGSFTYAYGVIQLFTFQIPLTFILANGVDHRFQKLIRKRGFTSWCSKASLHLPFMFLLSIQILMAYFFWLAYGTLAFLIGPLRTWSVFMAIILWYLTLSLPEKCAR